MKNWLQPDWLLNFLRQMSYIASSVILWVKIALALHRKSMNYWTLITTFALHQEAGTHELLCSTTRNVSERRLVRFFQWCAATDVVALAPAAPHRWWVSSLFFWLFWHAATTTRSHCCQRPRGYNNSTESRSGARMLDRTAGNKHTSKASSIHHHLTVLIIKALLRCK